MPDFSGFYEQSHTTNKITYDPADSLEISINKDIFIRIREDYYNSKYYIYINTPFKSTVVDTYRIKNLIPRDKLSEAIKEKEVL